MLIDASNVPFVGIALLAISVLAGVCVLLVNFSLRTRGHRAVTGHEGLVGASGVVRRDIEPGRQGMVLVLGELWRATAETGRLREGERVVVQRVDGLMLIVRRANNRLPPPARPAAPVTAKSKAAGL